MQLGDKVRLKRGSQLRDDLGAAADETGTVSAVVGLTIAVDYPDVPFFTTLLPAADFTFSEPRESVEITSVPHLP